MDQVTQLANGIDRASPEPFYLQLARLIEEGIDRGDFAAGDRIPSESELCRSYDLARSTVRETLRTLEDRSRIRVVPRRGAFVLDPKGTGWVLQVADGFFEHEVDRDQRKVETEVLEAKMIALTGTAAKTLGVSEGGRGFILRRRRRLDGKVALLSVNYLLPELGDVVLNSEVMQPHGSLNRVLKAQGYRVYGARRVVESVGATSPVAKLLDVAEGSPLLLITSVSWDQDQKVFDYYTAWVRTDVVKVTVAVSAASNSI
jgi:GntR family transcriptional regulator